MSAERDRALFVTDLLDDDPAASPVKLESGTVFADRYEIQSVLGVGGYAIVYSALDLRLQTRVAIKVLRKDRLTNSAVRRFGREVTVARDTHDPRLVRVYDIGATDGTLYITMELVDGRSLREELHDGPLSVDRAVRITLDVVQALATLHAIGIVHRDIKPENILVTPGGEIKVADFGLARYTEGKGTTQTDTVAGTFEYLSPEQAMGRRIDARSDLYSVGVLLFEMLTGSLPYESYSALGTLIAHVQQRPQTVRSLRRDVPRWLDGVVARLLEKEPPDRYASAEEVAVDLRKHHLSRRWRSVRKITPAAMLLVAVLAGTWLAWDRRQQSRFERIVTDGRMVTGVDHAGRPLWRVDSVGDGPLAIARLKQEGRRVAVYIPLVPGRFRSDENHTATVMDVQTGERLRSIRFPKMSNAFATFSDTFVCASIQAHDLDGDGWDELVVAFTHEPYYPSYTIVMDGATGAHDVVFLASGRHIPAAAVDLDGDGRKELIFVGPNNRMGWYTGVAAVRVPPNSQPTEWARTAATPDTAYPFSLEGLLSWYTLLPAGGYSHTHLSVDPRTRQIHIRYPDDRIVTLGYDGFTTGGDPAANHRRELSRRVAFAQLRDLTRTLDAGSKDEGVLVGAEAERTASESGDAILVEWAKRLHARALVAAGHFEEAEQIMAALTPMRTDAGNAAWDIARAYHLAGRTDDAVRWYRRGHLTGDQYGRIKYEYLDGIVVALAKERRWSDASREIERFASAYPNDAEAEWGRRMVEWRSTGHVTRTGDLAIVTDLHRYWNLEFRLSAGEPLQEIEQSLRTTLAETSEVRPMLLSLQAELLSRTNRREEAKTTIAQALREATALAPVDPIVASHLPLIEERAKRM